MEVGDHTHIRTHLHTHTHTHTTHTTHTPHTNIPFSTRIIPSLVFAHLPVGSTPGCELMRVVHSDSKFLNHPLPAMERLSKRTPRTAPSPELLPRMSNTRGSKTAVTKACVGSISVPSALASGHL